jgi:hypothetical protein
VDGVGHADEVLLGAVVEVALQALSLGVARRDDARPRAADLLLDALPRCHVEPAEEVPELVVGVADDRRGPVDDETLPVGADVLVLDDAGGIVLPQMGEVLLRARDVLAHDEELPERASDPGRLREPGGPLERGVHAEQDPVGVDEGEEARRRADDRVAEVAPRSSSSAWRHAS